MRAIPGTYHPPENSILHEWFGDAVSGEVVWVEDDRVYFRIEFEERQDWEQPHTITVVCEHNRVTIG